MAVEFFHYKNCGTCKKAIKFLEENDIDYRCIDIVESPPSKSQLKKALAQNELKRLFNTSGQLYRELNVKERILEWSEEEALNELTSHGKLVKRPFLVGDGFVLVGFKDQEWKDALL